MKLKCDLKFRRLRTIANGRQMEKNVDSSQIQLIWKWSVSYDQILKIIVSLDARLVEVYSWIIYWVENKTRHLAQYSFTYIFKN